MRSTILLIAGAILLVALPARAQVLQLQFINGRVNLDAHEVSVRQILERWAQVGEARIVNADKISDTRVTMRFVDQPEETVLGVLLSDVAGYILGRREYVDGAATSIDRILILPTRIARPKTVPEFSPVAGVDRGIPVQAPAAIGAAVAASAVATGSNSDAASVVGAPSEAPLALPQHPMAADGVHPATVGGFVVGIVDDRGKPVIGPTAPPADPPAQSTTETGTVAPNPFGATAGSARPGMTKPVPRPQP